VNTTAVMAPRRTRVYRPRTWEVLQLDITPAGVISLCCPPCGTDAEMPIAHTESPVIAAIGLGLIFDNPSYNPGAAVLPRTLRCRTCRHLFTRTDPKQ